MQADGPAAELADLADDAGVDLVAQHADDDGERGVVGVAAALDLARLRPAAAMARSIGLPPPWTRTGRRPTVSMKTTSCSVACRAAGSSMALPPSLMTVRQSRKVRM